MGVAIGLQLQDRQPDRVFVSVVLEPDASCCWVDEVTVQLLCPLNEELGPRVQLPIRGALEGPITTQVELRSGGLLPNGCSVSAVAWSEAESVTANCPADPSTSLAGHMVGSRLAMADPEPFTTLSCTEKARLIAVFPWLKNAMSPCPKSANEPLDADEEPDAHQLAQELGISEADAEWIAELLGEE